MESFDLGKLSASIASLDDDARLRARARWNAIAKPIGGLGELERIIEHIAALTGSEDVDVSRRCACVLCADNGVVEHGVSQCGPEVTGAVARNIGAGVSSVCMMCAPVDVDVVAVDIGMREPCGDKRVLERPIACATGDIAKGPAMTREQALRAIQVGIDLVGELRDAGYRLIASGEMGIGNTTTSSAMAAVLLGAGVSEVTGRGAGLSDEGLSRKVAVIERAIEVNDPDPDDALDVLSKLGGFDIAGMTGLFIGGGLYRVPVIVDGLISALSAYVASLLCPRGAISAIASHMPSEPAGRPLLERLGLAPVIHAGLHLGEGTGAVCLIPLLDMALSLYSGTTFAETGIEPYEVDPR